jgi:hypothetical protein
MRRFQVVEESMLPTLRPGDVVVARRDTSPGPGSIVVLPHPGIDGMWIVKRLAAVADGEAWVESDNTDSTMADSRTLGWVPTDGIHRAIFRYRRPLSLARL